MFDINQHIKGYKLIYIGIPGGAAVGVPVQEVDVEEDQEPPAPKSPTPQVPEKAGEQPNTTKKRKAQVL